MVLKYDIGNLIFIFWLHLDATADYLLSKKILQEDTRNLKEANAPKDYTVSKQDLPEVSFYPLSCKLSNQKIEP